MLGTSAPTQQLYVSPKEQVCSQAFHHIHHRSCLFLWSVALNISELHSKYKQILLNIIRDILLPCIGKIFRAGSAAAEKFPCQVCSREKLLKSTASQTHSHSQFEASPSPSYSSDPGGHISPVKLKSFFIYPTEPIKKRAPILPSTMHILSTNIAFSVDHNLAKCSLLHYGRKICGSDSTLIKRKGCPFSLLLLLLLLLTCYRKAENPQNLS